MKMIFTVKWFAAALVCAGFAINLHADTAKVVHIKGAARYTAGNNVWQTLHTGDILNAGAVIQTASESTVDIVIGEETEDLGATPVIRRFSSIPTGDEQRNIIRLRENTVLALDKMGSEKTGTDTVVDTQIDLRAGRILGNVKKLSAASRFEVKIPNGVAGIRGTLFELSADGFLKVFIGSVVISYYDSATRLLKTQTLTAGYVLDLSNGNIHRLPAAGPNDPPPTGISEPRGHETPQYPVIIVSPVLGDNTPPPPPPLPE